MKIQLQRIFILLICCGLTQTGQAKKIMRNDASRNETKDVALVDATLPAKVEAENWLSMSGVSTEATSDVGGGLNVGWVDANDFINYAISVPVAGTYSVDFRISSTSNNNTFQLKSGAAVLTTVNVPNTGGWQVWQTVTSTITLNAGSQTLQLFSLTGGLNINWLEFKTTGATGTPIPAKIEAESWLSMTGVSTQATTDVGGGLNVGWTDPGDVINYAIYVPTAGNYPVDFRISTVVSTASLQVRSGASVLTTVNLPLTSGWQNWQTVSTTVPLSAGSQTIQIYVATSGWNFNWLEFKNLPPVDVTAPAAISSLTTGVTTSSSVILSWTAPGDDNNTGTASSYNIRYSTSPITSANFSSAIAVTGVPVPAAAGTYQTATVTGLTPSTTYYFALKTSDEVPNISALSNVVSTATSPNTTPTSTITIDKFLGANGFVTIPVDKMQAVGIIREYHNWSWDEGDIWQNNGVWKGDTAYWHYYPNSQMRWQPSLAGNDDPQKKWRFDTFYTNAKNGGVIISPDIKDSPPWLHGGKTYQSFAKPTDEAGASTTDPNSYEKKAHEMFEFAARYGSTPVADNLLTLGAGQPRNSGMNLIKYVEDWNEQDANWWGNGGIGYFSPQEYAAMASADYDGHGNTMHQGAGTFGVKNADPNIKLVMGGIFQLNLNYIQQMKAWFEANRSDHKFAIDVINLHHYAWLYGDPMYGGPAKSPEQDDLKGKMKVFTDYRNQNLPGKEVWLSEFGYDTYPSSPLSPPQIGSFDAQEVQGQWIVRSFLALAAADVDRAMVYTMLDGTPSATQFATSGLLLQDSTPKTSWFYVYTLKNALTNMVFTGEQTASDTTVLIYKFKNINTNEGVYAVWCKTATDHRVNGFNLPLATTATSATLTKLTPGDTDGVTSTLTLSGGKVSINVTESPVFVTVNDITGTQSARLSQEEITTALAPQKENDLSVYPNPATHFIMITNINGPSLIQLYDTTGGLQLQRQATENETRIDVSSMKKGLYIIKIKGKQAYQYSKVIIE